MNGSVSGTQPALVVHSMTQSAIRLSGLGLIVGPVLLGAGSALGVTAFLLGIGAIVGFALVAWGVLRSPVYPRGAGILMLLTTFLFFFGFMVAEYLPATFGVVNQAVLGLALAAAFAWLGAVLWRSPATPHSR